MPVTRKRWSEPENDQLREAFAKHPNNKEVAISSAANALKRTEMAVGLQWRRLNGDVVKVIATAPKPKAILTKRTLIPHLVGFIMKSMTPTSTITVGKDGATITF